MKKQTKQSRKTSARKARQVLAYAAFRRGGGKTYLRGFTGIFTDVAAPFDQLSQNAKQSIMEKARAAGVIR